MNLKIKLVLIVVTAALLAVLWRVVFPSEERRVMRMMDSLAERASKTKAESQLQGGLVAASLAESFADGCTFRVPEVHFRHAVDRDRLKLAIVTVRRNAQDLRFSLEDPTVEVMDDAANYVATLFVSDSANALGLGGRQDARPVRIELVREETSGEWLIRSVRVDTRKMQQ